VRFNGQEVNIMKKLNSIVLFIFLIMFLVGCSNAAAGDTAEEMTTTQSPVPATESKPIATSVPTEIPPTPEPEEVEKDWPDALPFCRANPDKPEGEADCWALKSVDEWLDLEPRAGDEFAEAYWPASLPMPPLPDGLEWEKESRLIKEKGGGYINFWVVVANEEQVPWPEAYFFCRSGSEGNEGESDCQRVSNVEEWLQIEIQIGDNLGIWPEGMPLPPLPEGMEWEKWRDPSIGEYFWLVVASE
jgi:hypothetical protein